MQRFNKKHAALLAALLLAPVLILSLIWTGTSEATNQQNQSLALELATDEAGPYHIYIPVIISGNPSSGDGPSAGSPSNPDEPTPPDDPDTPVLPGAPGEIMGTGFEIDGDTALNNGGDYDWETADYPPAIWLQDPHSKSQRDETIFKPDGKFADPAGWKISAGKVGPPQTELTNLWTWLVTPSSLGPGKPTATWLLMAMERTKEEGTFYLDFEYNQMPWDGSNGSLVRTPGDLVVGYGIPGNQPNRPENIEMMILQYLPGQQPSMCSVTPGPGQEPAAVSVGNDPCPAYGDSGFYYRFLGTGGTLIADGLGEMAINDAPFPAVWDSYDAQGNPRSEIGAYEFMEASLNLAALGVEANCSLWDSVHAKGRSSLAIKSDLKDLVGPVDLIVNCRIDGYKFLDVDGDGSWDESQEPGLEGWQIGLNDGQTAVTDADGYYSFEGLSDGDYTVSEMCPAGWVQTAPVALDGKVCGGGTYQLTVNLETPEYNDINFGNGRPELEVSKSCPESVFVGDDLSYEVMVTNTGNVNVNDIVVDDDLQGMLGEIAMLAPGESKTFEYTREADSAGSITNVATASGSYGPAGYQFEVTDEDTCTTESYELTVSKDVTTSLSRIYFWDIEKGVDSEQPILLFRGEFTDLDYHVTVDLASGDPVDSDWQVSGTITIVNPAPINATLQEVRDEMTGGISSAVSCPALLVPANGSLVCTFGPTDLPNDDTRTNTATAVLINNNGDTTDFTGTAPVDFGDAIVDAQDESVFVTDSMAGDLGVVSYDETPKTFNYTVRVGPYPEDVCGDLPIINTATFETNDTGTTGSATQTVDLFIVCQVRIGMEDLPISAGNDWDYNDIVFDVSVSVEMGEPVEDNTVFISRVDLVFEQRVRLSAQTHQLHTQPLVFGCGGTYTKRTTFQDGTVQTTTNPYVKDQDVLVYPNSGDPPKSVELSFVLDPANGGCPSPAWDDPLSTFHGESLFFNPWIKVREHAQEEIHPGDPRMLAVPDFWQWPMEKQAIWIPYPCVIAGDPPTFVPFWWRCGV